MAYPQASRHLHTWSPNAAVSNHRGSKTDAAPAADVRILFYQTDEPGASRPQSLQQLRENPVLWQQKDSQSADIQLYRMHEFRSVVAPPGGPRARLKLKGRLHRRPFAFCKWAAGFTAGPLLFC
jgi:hypothetical protein